MRPSVALMAILAVAAPAAAQSVPSLKDVLRRVESYVASYGEKASIVVCTERYTQQARGAGGWTVDGTRALVSDFAIVRADAIRGWIGFRDVLEVDGHPVANRDDRLARVLMGSEGRFDEARRLSDESARYNIGSITRNFNVPTSALFFFVHDNRDRFRFARREIAEDGTWAIAFDERSTPSLIRTPEGWSVPSAGTIHVLPDTGVVVRTVLKLEFKGDSRGTGQIDVRYARVDALDMWLPVSMDESFEVSPRKGVWSRVSGRADYSNYRVFTTSVRIK